MSDRSTEAATAWHDAPDVLARFLVDLVSAELKRLRPGGGALPPAPWPAGLALGEDGLGLDSLERLEVATAVSEALHLHESEVDGQLAGLPTFGDWVDVAARGLARHSSRLTFRTSGSSGEPKRCTHALGDLLQEIDALAGLFPDSRRLLTAVPAHHIYGFLFSVLLPWRLGNLAVVDVQRTTPQALSRRLAHGDLLVSHPTHWSLMARHAGAIVPGVTGVSSTAPCPPELAVELTRRAGGLARLVEIYGSSETAGVGWRERPTEPFQLMPHWARAPGGDPDALCRDAADGRSSIRLQDVVDWVGERSFHVTGRRDSAVQVSGINVFPARVSAVLRTHAQVAEATVRPMPAHEGGRLKAFVVPREGADIDTLRADLERWSDRHLSAAERPRAYTFGMRLPVTETGKDSDWI